MSTMTSAQTVTDVLASLDFTPALPCEHSTHKHFHVPGDPAAWVVLNVCPACGHLRRYLLCDSGREVFLRPDAMLECAFCEHVDVWSSFAKYVERLEGR